MKYVRPSRNCNTTGCVLETRGVKRQKFRVQAFQDVDTVKLTAGMDKAYLPEEISTRRESHDTFCAPENAAVNDDHRLRCC